LRILFYGAGVIGSIYAARLGDSGQDVSILARGRRLAAIKGGGITLEEVGTNLATKTSVSVVERLSPDDSYDLVVVCVRRDQLPSVLPALEQNRRVPSVLFMLNNAEGLEKLSGVVGTERVLGGLPGVGGSLDEETVKYLLISQQPTVIGEPSGRNTTRLHDIKGAFEKAGLPTDTTGRIDALLKTHAMFMTCIESAIHLADDDNRRLARSPSSLRDMVEGVREGFRVLRALKTPVTPRKLGIMFTWMPRRYPVGYWRRELQGELGDYSLAPHTRAAVGELREMVGEVRELANRTAVPTPAMDRLFGWADSMPRADPRAAASSPS
jgi:2-dehydropantoate 2-reductase